MAAAFSGATGHGGSQTQTQHEAKYFRRLSTSCAIPSPSSSSSHHHHQHQQQTSSLHTHRQNHNSSKLPAFRFADLAVLNKPTVALPLPSLLQHMPPSPVSPNAAPVNETVQSHAVNETTVPLQGLPSPAAPAAAPEGPPANPTVAAHHNNANNGAVTVIDPANPRPTTLQHQPSQKNPSKPAASPSEPSPQPSPPRSRASTFQPSSASSTKVSVSPKRPASFPTAPATHRPLDATNNSSATDSSTIVAKAHRRAPASCSANGLETLSGPPSSLSSQRLQAVEAASHAAPSPVDKPTKDWPHGQRELLLPKTLQESPTDEKRGSAPHRPPPVSFKASLINTSGPAPVRVPPIRGFRSSGSRRSLILDTSPRLMRAYDLGDDFADSNQRDRTLRALEGRADDDMLQLTPPDSAEHDMTDGDDTGDVFLKIARQESNCSTIENKVAEEQGAIARVIRSSHRRPLSAAIPSYKTTSPPRLARRLSDQQETARKRRLAEESSMEPITRTLTYRALAREKALSVHPGEDVSRKIRPAPITPRALGFPDASTDNFQYGRRRTSVSDSTVGPGTRTSPYRQTNPAFGGSRAYNPSPLAPKTGDVHDSNHGVEGTESTASTTGPSTVWDELDDLKSRIHRLELTGKLPTTSGGAMSRVSDERPATANTTVTTISTSPKRGMTVPDGPSAISSHHEVHPVLHAALLKSKPFLSADVYRALESATADSLALLSMMGSAGQPGPISSGASTIGVGTTTDRQLRRKADGICRSLTELCLALSDESAQPKPAPSTITQIKDSPSSPTVARGFAGPVPQRRPSAVADATVARPSASPRAMTKLEERRNNLLAGGLPSPRYGVPAPATPAEGTGQGRRSSLLVARSRRAGTEEPDEGRKSSLLLRTRRAGTEEPDEGRKTSLLLRQRRGADGEEDEARFRVPSRAVTEVHSNRGPSRDYSAGLESSTLASSALPRRRLVPSTLNSRLVTPSTQTTTPARRYLERQAPERDGNSVVDKLAEERGQRPLSLGQAAVLNRTGSLNRRQNRESIVTNLPTAAHAGAYR